MKINVNSIKFVLFIKIESNFPYYSAPKSFLSFLVQNSTNSEKYSSFSEKKKKLKQVSYSHIFQKKSRKKVFKIRVYPCRLNSQIKLILQTGSKYPSAFHPVTDVTL